MCTGCDVLTVSSVSFLGQGLDGWVPVWYCYAVGVAASLDGVAIDRSCVKTLYLVF